MLLLRLFLSHDGRYILHSVASAITSYQHFGHPKNVGCSSEIDIEWQLTCRKRVAVIAAHDSVTCRRCYNSSM